MLKRLYKQLLLLMLVTLPAGIVVANEKEKQAVVDQKIKLETLNVVKDATQLIEDVGYPEVSRLKIFLSHGSGKYFGISKVTVQLDGVDRASYEYSDKQRQALLRGASNRVYIGSVSEGIHELVVVFEGFDRKKNIIKKARTWLFDKHPGEYIAVLSVSDDEGALRPLFDFKIIKGKK